MMFNGIKGMLGQCRWCEGPGQSIYACRENELRQFSIARSAEESLYAA